MKPMQSSHPMVLVAFAAAGMTALACAAGDSRKPSKLFRQLDANHDGLVSRSEAASVRGIDRAFADADDNRDGMLSPDEFIKAESINQRKRMAEFAADSVITAKIKAALLKDLELKWFDVDVSTSRGRVLLSGMVDDRRQARHAAQLASAVPGVERVENALKSR